MNTVLNKKGEPNQEFVKKISNGNKKAFEELFFCYHGDLCMFATKIIKSSDQARDIVQEVFLRLWHAHRSLDVKSSLKAYLYQAVWNEALNARKRRKNRRELAKNAAFHVDSADDALKKDSSQYSCELIKEIWKIVGEMPERRRFVFTLHRKHGLSYKEIGKVMNISRKTVENHMGLALKEIRKSIDSDLLTPVQLKHCN